MLEGAVRTRRYPARLPHYSTVRAHHRTWAPSRAPCLTHIHITAHAEHFGGEGVVGGFAANRRLSEAPVAAVYWN